MTSCARPVSVAVIGNIGVGKSSVLTQFREHGSTWTLVDEPVDEWKKTGLLQAFYEDPKNMAAPFQFATFSSRLKRLKQSITVSKSYGILVDNHMVVDRYVFAKVNLQKTPAAMKAYDYTWDNWQQVVPESYCDVVIYLRAPPSICLQRIKLRNRLEEKDIKLEYLTTLHKHFEKLAMDRTEHFGKDCDFYTLDVKDMSVIEVYEFVHNLCMNLI